MSSGSAARLTHEPTNVPGPVDTSLDRTGHSSRAVASRLRSTVAVRARSRASARPGRPPSVAHWHTSGMSGPTAQVAVVGGSGFYEFLDDVVEVDVPTPYGEPSAALAVGQVLGTAVAFLPRHGRRHELAPHRVNYRANMWALRAIGVRQVLAPCAVGGLTGHVSPGDVVVPDQLVDRTSGRVQSYIERGAAHVPFADPYCPALSGVVAAQEGVRRGGTMVVVEGPRFSTRAESQHYAAQGWSLVNMTGHPEAVLAREMLMCYTAVALVTDMDAGVEFGQGVGQAEVFATFDRNLARLKRLLTVTVPKLPRPGEGCACTTWAEGLVLPYELP